MASTTTISEQPAEAERPNADAIATWLRLTSGDEYGALLCATANEAAQREREADAALIRGEITLPEASRTWRVRDDTSADVAQYFGETLVDQHPAVRRAAGCRP